MNKEIWKRIMRMPACALALMLVMSGFALAQDRDGDNYRRGPGQAWQYGYQDRYANGFQVGFRGVSDQWRHNDGDRDERWRDGDRGWRNIAYQFGYQDGSDVARRDIGRHNRYNPNPRGKYDDEDHGYRREYGSKDQYKTEYANGYRAGYAATMGRRY